MARLLGLRCYIPHMCVIALIWINMDEVPQHLSLRHGVESIKAHGRARHALGLAPLS